MEFGEVLTVKSHPLWKNTN